MNLVCEIPCFTHDTGKNEVAIQSSSCEPFHRASPSATEVPLEPYSTLNGMTKSHFPHEKMKSSYVKWPVLHTARQSRMQNPVFYSRPSQNWCSCVQKPHFYSRQTGSVCEKADFTHGMIKLIPVDSVLSTKSGVFVEKMRSFRVLSTESGVFVDKTC